MLTAEVIEAAHVVGGEHRPGSDCLTIADAPDAAPAFAVPTATNADIEEGVEDARRAFDTWRRTPSPERAAVLRRGADELLAASDELVPLIVRETGKPIRQARGEVRRAAQALGDVAAHVADDSGRALLDYSQMVWGLELREPRGPSVILNTWNLPVQIAAVKAGAALGAGCSAIIKPSPLAPCAVSYLQAALARAGLPPGCLSILQGGSTTAEALICHPSIRVVSLTGQDTTGRKVMRLAAKGLKKVVLELGGKSANLVFADASIDEAAAGIVAGFVRNQGATCTAATRAFVEDEVFDEVASRVREALRGVLVGDPYSEASDVGAIRHRELYERLQNALAGAAARGGEVVGGERLAVPGRSGHYMEPALVFGLSGQDSLAQDELFGPILSISSFSGVQEAVSLANSTRYGLAAGVWSRDLGTLEHVWRELDVGTVYVNSYHRIDGIPLASEGRGASGFGVENGRAGIEEFQCTKSVHLPRGLPEQIA
jgi:betaine-aldehyde dehydrogenase